jgi:hypothetical protein
MITNAYTIQFLVEGTLAVPPSIVWRELANEAAGFAAHVCGVEITLTQIHTRPALRTRLSFRCGVEEFSLYAPVPVGWFGRKYASPDDADLAERLRVLLDAVARQCSERQAQAYAHPEEVRERIYKKLLFGQLAEAGPRELVKA